VAAITDQAEYDSSGIYWQARVTFEEPQVVYGGLVETVPEGIAAAEAYWAEFLRRADLHVGKEPVASAPPLTRYQFDENTWFVEFDGMMIGIIRRPDEPDEDLNDGLWHWSAKDVLHHRITPQYGANADLEDSFRALEDYWSRWLDEVGLMAKPTRVPA
jgi:hypothetical protein